MAAAEQWVIADAAAETQIVPYGATDEAAPRADEWSLRSIIGNDQYLTVFSYKNASPPGSDSASQTLLLAETVIKFNFQSMGILDYLMQDRTNQSRAISTKTTHS